MKPSFVSSAWGFRISTPSNPAVVRQKLRDSLVEWFQIRSAPRGIVLGPILWLWTDVHSSQHATLIAFLARDGWGSRIVGTTSYVIAVLASLMATIGVACWAIAGLVDGSLYAMGVIPILIILAALFGLIVLLTRRLDHARNPSVQLLCDLLVHPAGEASRLLALDQYSTTPMAGTFVEMELVGSNGEPPVTATPERLHQMLLAMENGDEDFIILQKNDRVFMQTAPDSYGYRIELRTEADDWPKPAQRAEHDQRRPFLIADVAAVMFDYLHGKVTHPDILWD